MNTYILVILLPSAVFLPVSSSVCTRDKSNIPSLRLKNDLLCDYDTSLRPVVHEGNSTSVDFRIILKHFDLDMHMNILSLDTWLLVYWKDEHLKWEPNDYNKISTIQLHINDIWVPDLSVYNRHEENGEPDMISSVRCSVRSAGIVTCVSPTRIDALCVPDLAKFPYDTQNCSVKIGSWSYAGEELNINVMKPPIDLEDLVNKGEWKILDVHTYKHPGIYNCCPNKTYPSITFSFHIERLTSSHTASIITPLFVVVIVTLTALLISPINNVRWQLFCVNLLAQFLAVENLSWLIPMRGDSVPLLLVFARDSLLLCSFAIALTVFLKFLMEKQDPPPLWILTFVSIITSSRVGQFLFTNDGCLKGRVSLNAEEEQATIITPDSGSSNRDWVLLAQILDRLIFVFYTIIYFIMMISLAP